MLSFLSIVRRQGSRKKKNLRNRTFFQSHRSFAGGGIFKKRRREKRTTKTLVRKKIFSPSSPSLFPPVLFHLDLCLAADPLLPDPFHLSREKIKKNSTHGAKRGWEKHSQMQNQASHRPIPGTHTRAGWEHTLHRPPKNPLHL